MQLPDPKSAVDGLLTSRAPRLYPPFFRAVFGGMDAERSGGFADAAPAEPVDPQRAAQLALAEALDATAKRKDAGRS